MKNFDYDAAEQLASDIRTARKSIDEALASVAAMTHSVIDICRTSDAPPSSTQAAIEGVAEGLSQMVSARKGFVTAHRKIAVAQRDSNLQEVDFGCMDEDPMRTAKLRVVNG